MKTLIIVGAGFSGVATTVQILRSGCIGLRIILINRTHKMARGLAYGTNSDLHLLNASVGKMSALDDVPDDFLRFCQSCQTSVDKDSFVNRSLYGDYLNDLLDEAERLNSTVQLCRVVAHVIQIRSDDQGALLTLSNGSTLKADHVVLAFGNFAPNDCWNLKNNLLSNTYTPDPWELPAPAPPDSNSAVLLLGTGLTAIDTALLLIQQGHRGTIHLLSRRGLLPLSHSTKAVAPLSESMHLGSRSPRHLMMKLRYLVKDHQRKGGDWREVIDHLRPEVQMLWQAMDRTQKRQFLRHCQSWWDVHRHRLAPATFENFQHYLDSGQLVVHAGRLINVALLGEQLTVDFRLRSNQSTNSLKISKIINCTGPNLDIQRVDAPLVSDLRKRGLIKAATCGLGILVDEQLRVQDQQAQPIKWLSYVGPMLKAQYWEATAVPELRRFSFKLARRLIEELASAPVENQGDPTLNKAR